MLSIASKTLRTAVPIAAAALYIQIGSAAAAGARIDFQQQVAGVLAGTSAHRAVVRPTAAGPDRRERDADTQAFVRRLLCGIGIAHRADADSGLQPRSTGPLEIADRAIPPDDEQRSVRRLLLGEHTPVRGAL